VIDLPVKYTTIRFEIDSGIAVVTLDRPDSLNALNRTMLNELLSVVDRTDADDSVRAVVVTGAGRGFCSGADLSRGQGTFDYSKAASNGAPVDSASEYASERARDGAGRLSLRLFRSLKPVVAAINGVAVGAGVTMCLPMDARIAADSARFSFVFSRRGIVPEACSSYFLPRLVGIDQALEWCYSGRFIDAPEALRTRLVREVSPRDQVLARAKALAHELTDGTAPVSIALIRQMMWRGLGWQHPMDAHRMDSRSMFSRGRSEDVKEGIRAHVEKRTAEFTDQVSKDMPDFFPWYSEPPYS